MIARKSEQTAECISTSRVAVCVFTDRGSDFIRDRRVVLACIATNQSMKLDFK